MHPPENEPAQPEIEHVVTDEERRALQDPAVPDEVKLEIAERLARFREMDLEQVQPE